MALPVPPYAQQAYAILRARYADDPFPSGHLARYISQSMVKKTLHALETAGWIERTERGIYTCTPPDQVFGSMVAFRVPEALEEAGMPYAYAKASAVEVWTDFTYIQRSWEHSPYHINVRSPDVDDWAEHLRGHRVSVFIDEAQPALGEFVIVHPMERPAIVTHDGMPVEPLETVVRYCEQNLDSFEYPLAYLRAKFGVETRAQIDERVTREAVRAV